MERKEQRNTPRALIHAVATEEFQSEEQNVTAINISEHGMCYHEPHGARKRQEKEVLLTFSLLERLEPIKVSGWVVEERETEEAIETHITFMFLSPEHEKMIQDYVSLRVTN